LFFVATALSAPKNIFLKKLFNSQHLSKLPHITHHLEALSFKFHLPHSNTKSLNYPKSTNLSKNLIFHPRPRIGRSIFSPCIEFITFSQLHPVLINFRISSPSKQSKVCRCQNQFVFNFFCTLKREFVVPAIIFSSASLRRFMLQNAAATPSEL
jgi:hypothetical protein